MAHPPTPPQTLGDAIRYFADPDIGLKFLVAIRWPDGVVCRRCGRAEPRFLAARRIWQCKSLHAHRQFSIKTGTILEDSPLGLEQWLPAAWLICNHDPMSSYELARALGVTQTTAWSMLDRIRRAWRPPAPYERFVTFMGQLIAVSKSEVQNPRQR
jgi:hypothetical protein